MMEWRWTSIFMCSSILLDVRVTYQAVNLAQTGVAYQSSFNVTENPASYAIDGISTTYFESVSMESDPWWRLDLLDPYIISSVEITRRSNCCSSEMHGAEIRIGNSLENNGNSNPSCAVIHENDTITQTYECGPMLGRYVNIFHLGDGKRVQLLEVKVYADSETTEVNLTQTGVANQSSVNVTENPASDDAVDGISTTYFESVGNESNPWWRQDLLDPYIICSVEITRRSNCCSSEMHGAEIRIGNSLENNGNSNPSCAVIHENDAITQTYECGPMLGRYVNIFLLGDGQRVQLPEVKVHAVSETTGVNVARSGVAAQSSTHYSGNPASDAIDGKPESTWPSGRCTCTNYQSNPWWRLDLRGSYDVYTIEITLRSDCCTSEVHGADILVGNSLENNGNSNPRCAVVSAQGDNIQSYNCGKMDGRYINIFLPGDGKRVCICEVKVYAVANTTEASLPLTSAIPTQSSPSETSPYDAIDEKSGFDDTEKTCTTLSSQDNPWWQLDLGAIYHIAAVTIFADGPCFPSEIDGAEVYISLRDKPDDQRCALIEFSRGHVKYTYQCGAMYGRFVHVVLPGLQKTLTICEVEVFAIMVENLALRGLTYQSFSWGPGGLSLTVVDGKHGSCHWLQYTPGHWVRVDLLNPYVVNVVVLAFKGVCCYYADVRVGDSLTNYGRNNPRCVIVSCVANLVTFSCNGMIGRYVIVVSPFSTQLTMCEVEIYGIQELEGPGNEIAQQRPESEFCSFCGHNYIFVNKYMTWHEAQTHCRHKYSDLATITNIQDMIKIIRLMGSSPDHLWIGLHEDAVTWTWSLSQHGFYGYSEAEFRSWDALEPYNPNATERCVGIARTGDWKKLNCTSLNYFFCYDGREAALDSRILVQFATTWTKAQQHCRQYHTDLLSIRNQAENQEIQSMVPSGRLAWIGLFGDAWRWSDGSSDSFRYWQQPYVSGVTLKCGRVSGWNWNGQSCDTKNRFLCYNMNKKWVLRIQTDVDTSDPLIQQQLLKKIEDQMKRKGMTDFKLRWKMSGVVRKADPYKETACHVPV